MLIFNSGIFDPATRAAALADAATTLGLDPEEEPLATYLSASVDQLDALFPAAPETHSAIEENLSIYLSIVIANLLRFSITQVTGNRDAIADIATADATDLASAVTLANATKAKVNVILGELRAANLILGA